ncbi:MAG: hypothetical protein GVY36_16205 [Verrucomicrobia bacterium]|jgi:hypothetical protein|nr:hypothetical protein [Verrucomicrobiota bacterium]
MSKHVESVKAVSKYLLDIAEKRQGTDLERRLREFAESLGEATDRLLELEDMTSALPPDLGNLHDLPDELLSELSVSKTDELEDQLVTVINAYGGEASLDQILVGLFRKFQVVQKRRFIQNKLYRMDVVWSVQGKKGHYTTIEPSESDALAEGIEELPSGAIRSDVLTGQDDNDSEIPF